MDKILIIDDDEDLCELVGEYLEVEGFEVDSVHDGAEGLSRALASQHDLIILDVMLPSKNGFDVLRDLRSESSTPVLMLTARGEDMERIVGLEIGADDYMPKPFNPRELVARIRAILRRSESPLRPESPDKLVVEDLEVSKSGRSAKLDGKKLSLTAIEFELLVALLENAGKVIEKENLSLQVLERELSPFDRSLDMHVSNLRKKLGNRDDGENRIKTIRSVGYIYTLSG
ncbi:MAG: response regulator transcription factor [Acidobacteriota bacterium]|nr:response regulator transcription factor [Acidobacteriota bacterium]